MEQATVGPATDRTPFVEMRQIVKRFGGLLATDRTERAKAELVEALRDFGNRLGENTIAVPPAATYDASWALKVAASDNPCNPPDGTTRTGWSGWT